MQYIPLIAVNWEATKEVKKELDSLTDEVFNLKKQIKVLKNIKTTKPMKQAMFDMQKKPKRMLKLKNIRVK